MTRDCLLQNFQKRQFKKCNRSDTTLGDDTISKGIESGETYAQRMFIETMSVYSLSVYVLLGGLEF